MFSKVPSSHTQSGSKYLGHQGYLCLPQVIQNSCLSPNGDKWAEPEDLHMLDQIPNPAPSKVPLLQKKTYMMDQLPVEYILIPSINKERLVPLNPVVALNPKMSIGIKGRGQLRDWGANFAADPVVTFYNTRLKQHQILLILRVDSLKWAFPGGKVDLTDKDCSQTAKRELEEETGLNLSDMLQNTTVIYQGYVDDDRNTDNAWMETSAVHFNLDIDKIMQEKMINIIKGADDAVYAMWFGLQLSENQEKIEIVNNFAKQSGTAKWGDLYKEICEKFKITVQQKTRNAPPERQTKEIILEDNDPIFTSSLVKLYASHDDILQQLKPILFK